MRDWSVYLLVSILHLRVLCNGNLNEKYKIDVYVYSKDDAQRFKKHRLEEFHPFLLKLYEICDDLAKQISELLSQVMELYNKAEGVPNQMKRIYDYINTDLAQEYEICMSKEKKMIQMVKNIVTTTCYKELQDWAEMSKLNCIKTIKQDEDYNIVKSNYAYFAKDIKTMARNYLVSKANKFLEDLSIRIEDVSVGFGYFKDKIYAALEEYVRELMLMRRMSVSTKDMTNFSTGFLINASSVLSNDINYWKRILRHSKSTFPPYLSQVNDIENSCFDIKKDLEECLDGIENEEVISTQQVIHSFITAQYFLVQNDSLVEVDCEDHIPIYGSKMNERLVSSEIKEDRTNVWHFKGKNKKNESYKRMLVVKSLQYESVIHETIIYSNSEIASLNNTYIVKFKT